MNFFKNNRKFFLYLILPVLIVIIGLSVFIKTTETETINSGQAVNFAMQDAVIDTTSLSKAELYDKAAKEKELNDPYQSNSNADVDFKLIPDNEILKKEEPSLEILAKMEEQRTQVATQNVQAKIEDHSKEYSDYKKKIRQSDYETIQAYQVPKADVIPATTKNIQNDPVQRRSFNSIKIVHNEVVSTPIEQNIIEDKNIPAVIMRDTKVSNNTAIVIRLMAPTIIDGIEIQKNSILNGIANVSGNRVTISLDGSSIQGQAIDYSFMVFDSDGMPGLKIDGVESGQIAHNTYRQQIQRAGSAVTNRLGTLGGIGSDIIGGLNQGGSRQKIQFPAGYKVFLKKR